MSRTLVVVISGWVLAACSSDPGTALVTTTALTPTRSTIDDFDGLPVGQPGCAPASPIAHSGLDEVLGTSSNAELHGLIFTAPGEPIKANKETKIVWRMTGRGELTTSVIAPDGSNVAVLWGPEPHESSSFQRPGDEWGVGYIFPQPGCWQLHLMRQDTAADVWLTVVG